MRGLQSQVNADGLLMCAAAAALRLVVFLAATVVSVKGFVLHLPHQTVDGRNVNGGARTIRGMAGAESEYVQVRPARSCESHRTPGGLAPQRLHPKTVSNEAWISTRRRSKRCTAIS